MHKNEHSHPAQQAGTTSKHSPGHATMTIWVRGQGRRTNAHQNFNLQRMNRCKIDGNLAYENHPRIPTLDISVLTEETFLSSRRLPSGC